MFKRKTNRLSNFDYSSPNYYFVTICVEDRTEFFGEILNQSMVLTEAGEIVKKYWLEIPRHYEGVGLDEFVIMPNHLHGIVIINDLEAESVRRRQIMAAGSRRYSADIPKIIAAFKSISSKAIHSAGASDFYWQKSFYDHVVRKEESLYKIREYISGNPLKWELDRNNPENLWM